MAATVAPDFTVVSPGPTIGFGSAVLGPQAAGIGRAVSEAASVSGFRSAANKSIQHTRRT